MKHYILNLDGYSEETAANTELINVFTGYVQTLDLFYMPSIC